MMDCLLPTPKPACESGVAWLVKAPPLEKATRTLGSYLHADPDLLEVFGEKFVLFCVPVTSTSIRDHGECRRRYFFRWRLGLVPVLDYRPAWMRGTWFHGRLSDHLKGTQDNPEAFVEWLASVRFLAKDGILPGGKSFEKFEVEARIDFMKAEAMADKLYYDWDVMLPDHKPLMVEQRIFFRAKGLSRVLSSRLDLLSADRDDLLWVNDHKSTGSAPVDVVAALRFDIQPQIYRLAAQALYCERRVAGVIHNVVATPTIKCCKKDDNDPAKYNLRVRNEWYSEQEKMAQHDPAKRPSVRSKVVFGDMPIRPSLMKLAQEVCVRSHGQPQLRLYPECGNNYTCCGVGGGKPCPYLLLCQRDHPQEWKQFIGKGKTFIQKSPYDNPTPEPGDQT